MLGKATLIGNLGKDPEMRYTPAGKPVVSFSVAHDVGRDNRKHTVWFRVTVWGDYGEKLLNRLQKGTLVYVEGDLDLRAYTDNSGVERYSLEVTGQKVLALKNWITGDGDAANYGDENPDADDIPF